MPAFDPDTLPIAVVGRPHGIHGEIRVHPFDPQSRTLDDFSLPFALWLDPRGPSGARDSAPPPVRRPSRSPSASGRRRWVVQSFRRAADACLLGFEGIDDRDAAKRLTGAIVCVDRGLLPPLAAGEYYVEDLTGCVAFDPTGRVVGTIRAVYWNGAHHVLSIGRDDQGDGHAEMLVPVGPGYVTAVDARARRVTVNPVAADADEPQGRGTP